MLSSKEIEELSRQIKNGDDPRSIAVMLQMFLEQHEEPEFGERETPKHYIWNVFGGSSKAVVRMNAISRILDVNEAFTSLFKFSRGEILGRNIHTVLLAQEDLELGEIPPAEPPVTRYESFNLHCIRKDGKALYVSAERYPALDSSESYLVLTDITERKRAEESLTADSVRGDIFIDIVHALWHDFMNYEKTLDVLTNKVSQHIGGSCIIHLFMENSDIIEHVAINHTNPAATAIFQNLLHATHWHASGGLPGEVVLGGNALIVPTVTRENISILSNEKFGEAVSSLGTRSLLVLPMFHDEAIIGTMTLLRSGTDQPYTNKDKTFTQRIANIGAMAIVHAQQMRRINNETMAKLRNIRNEHQHYMFLQQAFRTLAMLEGEFQSSEIVENGLKYIGESLGAESVCMALTGTEQGVFRLRGQWSSGDFNPVLVDIFGHFVRLPESWRTALEAGTFLYRTSDEFTEEEHTLFDNTDLMSVAVAPMTINASLKGFISLENCVQESGCFEKSETALKTLASILGRYIARI